MTMAVKSDNTFWTSDTHFSHVAMIRLLRNQFKTVEEMNAAMIAAWNEVVPPDGVVFHLGDVSFAGREVTVSILGQLNGRKYLVRGNHDKKKSPAVMGMFQEVYDLMEIDVREAGGTEQRVTMCHFAMRVWNRHHHGAWQLHGHSHGSLTPHGRQLDVGVDCNNLRPFTYEQIKERLKPVQIHEIDHHTIASARQN